MLEQLEQKLVEARGTIQNVMDSTAPDVLKTEEIDKQIKIINKVNKQIEEIILQRNQERKIHAANALHHSSYLLDNDNYEK